jgi:hypothetical protein
MPSAPACSEGKSRMFHWDVDHCRTATYRHLKDHNTLHSGSRNSKHTTRYRQKQKIENYPLTSPPSCQHTTIRKNCRERTTINEGTTIISITTTTQAKHQKEHCNKTGHTTNKICKKKNPKWSVTITV